jgi:hypothetical protein
MIDSTTCIGHIGTWIVPQILVNGAESGRFEEGASTHNARDGRRRSPDRRAGRTRRCPANTPMSDSAILSHEAERAEFIGKAGPSVECTAIALVSSAPRRQ